MDKKTYDELMRRMADKEITLCETCDNFFAYGPQRRFCGECKKKRLEDAATARRFRYANDPEFRERLLAQTQQWVAKKKQEDSEWASRRNERRRKRYHEKKKEEQ